jgi:hypothetical protein
MLRRTETIAFTEAISTHTYQDRADYEEDEARKERLEHG